MIRRATPLALLLFVFATIGATGHATAQDTDKPKSFTTEQLEQFVAPLALYPDDLVSQILMASTYPLEVVQADRWAKANESLKGQDLAKALDGQTWDPSVKSLVNFPQVLDMMNEKLDWLTNLGDAFIGQQADVLAAIQRLRAKAKDAGNLESNQQQTVTVEQAPAGAVQTQTIVIQSASPDVVYVPTYNPTVVYGAWPYPAYPPYYYRPPGYVAATAALSFGVGVACGAAWGYAWGDCDWGHNDIDIDTNRNVNRNSNIQNTREYNNRSDRQGTWNHDGSHRGGAAYRDQGTAERFGRGGSSDAARAREQFRGRADSDRAQLDRSGANRGDGSLGSRSGAHVLAIGRGPTPGPGGPGAAGPGAARFGGDRSGRSGSAFDRSGGAGSARSASSRGSSSRSGASRS